MEKVKRILALPFWRNRYTVMGLWLLMGLIAGLTKMSLHRCNNFLIFKGVFWHTINQSSLYAPYPDEYFDVNHYGPLFSLIIAPFAVVPHWMGMILWCTGLAAFAWWAVRRSTLSWSQQVFAYWFCAHELLTALFMQQFNIAIAGIIILSYFFVERGKDHWATLLIVIGTLVKLYGIVGLAFFFFSKHKLKFILSGIAWTILLLALPMLISSPEYIINTYQEWFSELATKNADNLFATHQNISLLGIVRKVSGIATYSDMWLIVPGLLLFCAPYLRFGQWQHLAFRQMFLASVLMFVCLFSTGTESSGYVIAMLGCVVWYVCAPWTRSRIDLALMVFVFILTSLSPSDLFPRPAREFVWAYGLKAFPVCLVWFKLIYEMLTRDYSCEVRK